MKIIQSFWSGKNIDLQNHYGWFSPKYNWLSWILSSNLLVKYHQDVELYTDNFGYEVLIKKLKLPYTKVHVVLNEIDNYDCNLWALAKIKTFELQTEPFIHVDGDVFVWESLVDKFKDSNLITQNLEVATDYYKDRWANIYPNISFLPKEIENFHLDFDDYATNMGIFGGNNIKFIKEFTKKSFEFVDKNLISLDSFSNHNFNIFFEQVLFYQFSSQASQKIDFLFQEISEDNDYKGFGDFDKVPKLKYLHLLGDYKRNPIVCKAMEVYVMKYFPNYYSSLKEILDIDFELNLDLVKNFIMEFENEIVSETFDDNFLVKRDLYNEGKTIVLDDFYERDLDFDIILLTKSFQYENEEIDDKVLEYILIYEYDMPMRFYHIDTIDKLILDNLKHRISFKYLLSNLLTYYDDEISSQIEFVMLIKNRIRNYLYIKIITIV